MNILDEIIEYKKEFVDFQKRKMVFSQEQFEEMAFDVTSHNSFIEVLNQNKNKVSLIAEVKKASPSKGLICEKFNPVRIAQAYEKAGASAISVLTDEKYFQGSIGVFTEVRNAVNLPLLRKDFIVDEFQIYQTKLMKADIILLIASALGQSQLGEYYEIAKKLNLDVLVEVHDENEMQRALDIDAKIIGINNRNLKTFNVSLETTRNLINGIKNEDRHFVSESGIYSSRDVEFVENAGASAILVGESLMKSDDIEKSVKELLA